MKCIISVRLDGWEISRMTGFCHDGGDRLLLKQEGLK